MSAAIRSKTGVAAACVLAAGWLATLAISWPGHLSYDSIVQLHDGRTGFYHSWHPPVMAWLLGLDDRLLPGAGLFVALDAGLLFAALLSLLWIAPRASWLAVGAAVLCVLLPQFLLYQMIVWKDVLFADGALAGFVCLAHAGRGRRLWTVAAFLFFALAALARQQGLIVLGIGAVALFFIAPKRRLLHAGAALGGALAIVIAANALLARSSDHGEGPVAQLRLLRLYDLIGAVVADPSYRLDRLKADAPELETLMRTDGARLYTPERNDTLVGSQRLQNELADTPPELMAAQWSDLVLRHPFLYVKVRARVFLQVLATPDIVGCRPVFVGVEGPAGEMGELGIAPRLDGRDKALGGYARFFMGTPAFSHPAFALLALVVTVLLFARRAPGDLAIAFLQVAAFAFAASFFVVSIACDYRYLYFLDMAALTGLFWLALDPAYLFQVLAMWSLSFWDSRSDLRKS